MTVFYADRPGLASGEIAKSMCGLPASATIITQFPSRGGCCRERSARGLRNSHSSTTGFASFKHIASCDASPTIAGQTVTVTRSGRAKAYQSAQPPVRKDRHAHQTSPVCIRLVLRARQWSTDLDWRAHQGRSARSAAWAIRDDIAEDDPAGAGGIALP
jgi:hypothetical protein